MDKDLDRIYQILQKLIGLHRQLLELIRSERVALEQANLKDIEETTHSKEVVIHAIHQNELERVRAMAQIAASWKQGVSDLSLRKFVEILQGKDIQAAERFRNVHNALRVLVERIDEQNQDNKKLVEKSLEHIAIMKRNALGEANPKSDTYTQKGRKLENQGGSARLLSKEV